MEPLSAELFKAQTAAKREQEEKEQACTKSFCDICNKPFTTQNSLENHLRSKKHLKEVENSHVPSKSSGNKPKISQIEVPSDEDGSDAESWEDDEEGEVLGLEQCLFCPAIADTLEANLEHMTRQHSFFLPDAEYICQLEELVVYLGQLISKDHMCLWCHNGLADQPSRFRSLRDVQKHMVDKGHCMVRFDESTQHNFADFYDYRGSYPDAQDPEQGGTAESVDPEMLVSSGYELVLPSGATIGHRSLVVYYKQNMGRREVTHRQTQIHRILAGYKALGWTGTTSDVSVRQRAKDVHYLQRMKNRFHLKVGTKNNRQLHYREQNPK